MKEVDELYARRVNARRAVADGVLLKPLPAAPVDPEDGLLVMADGTNWNPGSGVGCYLYKGGLWVFVA